jgi:hypothetical protein
MIKDALLSTTEKENKVMNQLIYSSIRATYVSL